MKRIATIALSIAATLLTSGSAFAQSHTAKATVPFNFTVNGNTMPAGTYSIHSRSIEGNLVTLGDAEQKVNMLALGQVDSNGPVQAGVLVFHKYGDRYFLSEVRYPSSSVKVYFPESRDEKRAKEGILEGSVRADNNLLIALR